MRSVFAVVRDGSVAIHSRLHELSNRYRASGARRHISDDDSYRVGKNPPDDLTLSNLPIIPFVVLEQVVHGSRDFIGQFIRAV